MTKGRISLFREISLKKQQEFLVLFSYAFLATMSLSTKDMELVAEHKTKDPRVGWQEFC